MRAVKVAKEEAEEARRELKERGVLLSDFEAESDESFVYFPVHKSLESAYDLVEREFEEKEKTPSFEDCVHDVLDEDERDLLKTSQDIVGDIAVIEVDEGLEHRQHEIGDCLLRSQPYLHTVLKKGEHTGTYRTQALEHLAGEEKKETVHTENGVDLRVHLEKMYFSPRLATERKRISEHVEPGERVLVMFSGCGPYPLVIAANADPATVVGVEINPDAHAYAVDNADRNDLDHVTFRKGDVADVVPSLAMFDRIMMPGPDNAEEYLDLAFRHLADDGALHFYNFFQEETVRADAEALLDEAAATTDREYEIVNVQDCGSVAPGRRRYCVDVLMGST